MRKQKLLKKILSGSKNVSFNEMISLVEAFGFQLSRVKGSHHIFKHPDIVELINIQKVGDQVKPYQVNQFLQLVEQYNLTLGENL